MISVKVWGDFACFTRPETRSERVSYEVMTPSAARNLLRSIFWKPAFDYHIQNIHVLRPVYTLAVERKELKNPESEERTLRNTLLLRDVAYVIDAEVHMQPGTYGASEHPAKYYAQLERRVGRGQCYYRPYLGCREFKAFFGPPAGDEQPIPLTKDLGAMLFDITYGGMPFEPVFFDARLERGTLDLTSHQHLYQRCSSPS